MPRRATKTSYGAVQGNAHVGGARKGSGPKGKTFHLFLKNLRNSAEAQAAIRKALADPDSRGFAAALKTVSDYDEQKPAKKVDLSVSESLAKFLTDL